MTMHERRTRVELVAEAMSSAAAIAINETLQIAINTAKGVADRDKYSPQESAAAWDVIDALVKLQTAGETVTPDPDADERDGKTIARAAEAEDHTDDCD